MNEFGSRDWPEMWDFYNKAATYLKIKYKFRLECKKIVTFQSRSMISSLPDDRKREFRSFGLTPLAAPAAYKYFSRYDPNVCRRWNNFFPLHIIIINSRSDVYNTTAIYNRSMTSNYSATARYFFSKSSIQQRIDPRVQASQGLFI